MRVAPLHIARLPRATIIVALLASACADAAPRSDPATIASEHALTPSASSAGAAPPGSMAPGAPLAGPVRHGAYCHSDQEELALRCAGGGARRTDDTLHVRTAKGPMLLVNDDGRQHEDLLHRYRYLGTLRARGVHHLVEETGYASVQVAMYDSASGHAVHLASEPMLSPGNAHFATAERGLSVCEAPESRVEIWRITNGSPVREWTVQPWNCDAGTGWGPGQTTWVSPDTLRVQRLEPAGGDTLRSTALVIRRGAEWRLTVPQP